MTPTPTTGSLEAKARLVLGALLVVTGAVPLIALYGLFLGLWVEANAKASGSDPNTAATVAFTLGALAGAGIVALGFFVTKHYRAIPIWYYFLTSALPGFLIGLGWLEFHEGIAKRNSGQPLQTETAGKVILGGVLCLIILYVIQVLYRSSR